MVFSQPEESVGLRRPLERELLDNRKASDEQFLQNRENLLINHLLGDDRPSCRHDKISFDKRISNHSRPSQSQYTQFDAFSPHSQAPSEAGAGSRAPSEALNHPASRNDKCSKFPEENARPDNQLLARHGINSSELYDKMIYESAP